MNRFQILFVLVSMLLGGAGAGVDSIRTLTPLLYVQAGDDNSDGVIDEDESGWDCSTMGNRLCG
nr:hypothetical protein [Rhodococcus sp. (in: high G+C Gram-positive bacteria)]